MKIMERERKQIREKNKKIKKIIVQRSQDQRIK